MIKERWPPRFWACQRTFFPGPPTARSRESPRLASASLRQAPQDPDYSDILALNDELSNGKMFPGRGRACRTLPPFASIKSTVPALPFYKWRGGKKSGSRKIYGETMTQDSAAVPDAPIGGGEAVHKIQTSMQHIWLKGIGGAVMVLVNP